MDPLSLTVGGALLAVGWLVGRVTRPPRDPFRCSCKHAFAFHDPTTDACDYRWQDRGELVCSCRRYVGERPPTEFDPADVLRALGSDRPTQENR